jgi:hypothetical protein
MPHVFAGEAQLKKNVNIPNLIANGGLENDSGVATSLPSTGFAAADILRVFSVPAGFWLHAVGVRVTTKEGVACTADIGCTSATQTHLLTADADGFMGTLDLNDDKTQIVLVADAQLGVNTGAGTGNMGVVYITDGTIDLTFETADTNVAVFDVFAIGWRCW